MRYKHKLPDYLWKAPTCKYCLKQIPGIPRYLQHLRHHETNIRPYWYKNSKLTPKSGAKRIWPKWIKYRIQQNGKHRGKMRKKYNHKCWKECDKFVSKILVKNDARIGNKAKMLKKQELVSYEEDATCSAKERKRTSNKKIKDILAEQGILMPHTCDYCNAGFKDGMSKRLHELVQHREQFLPLSFIKKLEEQKKAVKEKEMREKEMKEKEVKPVEIEEKHHKCDFCSARFHNREKKKLHEMTHKGKKPHKCDYCDQTFTFKNRKLRHEIYHTGVKPHKCSYCEKEFIYASDKRHHEAKHRGHKTYKCRFCDQEFDYNTEKVKHEKEHTGGKRYMCQNCRRKFRYPSDVREHWKNSRHCGPAYDLNHSTQPAIAPAENEKGLKSDNTHVSSDSTLTATGPPVLLDQAGTSFKNYLHVQPLIVIPKTGTSTVTLQPCATQPWVVPLRASELLAHIKSMENGKPKSNGEQTKQALPSLDEEKVTAVPKNNVA